MRKTLLAIASLLLSSCGGTQAATPEVTPGVTPNERTVVTTTTTEMIPPIIFVDDAILPDTATSQLEAIAATLESNPDITLLGVVTGGATLELAERRGQVIIDELVKLGVSASRLKNQPRTSDKGNVEFPIIEPSETQE